MDKLPFKQLMLDGHTQLRLSELRKELSLPSKAAVVRYLLAEHSTALNGPLATAENLLADSRPCLVVGPSGSGKTNSIKKVLPSWTQNVLVLDVSDEYPDLAKVNDSREVDWQGGGRVRIVPSAEAEYSQIEAAYLFRDLVRLRSSGVLTTWLVCVEEGHRFASDPNLKDLALEARKYIGKLIIATADPGPLRVIMPVFSPLPVTKSPDGPARIPRGSA